MEFLAQLWLPIAVSAGLVFIASSLIHMIIQWHKPEFHGFSNEDAVGAAIRAGNAAPGQYLVPYCSDMKEIKTPEMQKKFEAGPIAYVTLRAPGMPHMGGALGAWFALNLAIAVAAAYIAAKVLPANATFGQVFRVAGTLSFLAYGCGSVQMGIWMGKPWSSVAKDLLDALIYGVITAGTFAYLWH
jgi:hypothetical protein